MTRQQAPAHKHDGTRHAHHLACRHQKIPLSGGGDEMHIHRDQQLPKRYGQGFDAGR